MKKTLFTILMFLLLCGRSAGAGMFDPESALEQAGKLAAEGRHDEALRDLLYSLLDADDRQKTEIHIARSRLYAETGKVLAALDEMDRAISSAPEDSCAVVQRALLYDAYNETGLALVDADSALRRGCSDPELTALRARLYLRNGDIINAIDWYYDVVFSEDHSFEALASIGLSYAMLGYPRIAADFYREALKIEDENPRVHAELADALTLIGDIDGALDHYKRSLALDSENSIATNNYAYTLVLTGHTDEAIDIFNTLNADNPNTYSLCNMLEINLARDNWQGSMVFGGLCLNAFRSDPEMLESERYYAAAALRAVTTVRQETLAVHPLTQVDLAVQHLEHGERAEALAAYLMALMMDPHHVEANFQAGRLFMEYGEPSRGASYLNLAASMAQPGDPLIMKARRIIDREALSLISNSWAMSDDAE